MDVQTMDSTGLEKVLKHHEFEWTDLFEIKFNPYKGVVKTLQDLSSLVKIFENETLTRYSTFSIRRKNFGSSDFKKQNNFFVYFDSMGVPYIHLNKKHLNCHNGKDKNAARKRRLERKRNPHELDHDYNVARIQDSKKFNCPASIYLTEILRFPQYQLPKNYSVRHKNKISQVLKSEILKMEDVMQHRCFIASLPDVLEHKNHFIGSTKCAYHPG